MSNPGAELECRVLVFAPIGRDGALTRELLGRASIPSVVCASLDRVCTEFSQHAGAIILTEEALDDSRFPALTATLNRQPAWSDIPVIVFAGGSKASLSVRTLGVFEALRNVTVIERPISIAAVLSVVRAALRARMRQYQMRDTLVALRAARSEAEEANRLKDEFLATLSHEMRTPLNAILGWTTMLRHGQVDASRVGHALEVVERNARAQAQLIEDVLDMARIITGKLGVDLRPVALGSIVDATVEAGRPGALAKGIRLQVTLRDVPTIRGDAGRLQQVLWNLLSNAVKFTAPGGEVSVSLGLRNSQAVITVSDTGAGVAPDFLPFIFDRFRQADQSVTRGHGGLGLGLSIVKHLVELHGGTVHAESAGIGKGTSFRVSLPIPVLIEPPVERRDRELRQVDAFAIRFDGCKILVVDDDGATRELLTRVLERTGATVEAAESARAAMTSIGRRPPDLLIADIGMPDEDGYSLIRRIRSLPGVVRAVPAIALSAYTRAEDRGAAEEAGFTRFIAKPATPQQLLRAVEALLNPPSVDRDIRVQSGPEHGGDRSGQ
jgi:signal transduction histidine kinase/ActR/RegA family two-component response regulator